MTQRGPLAVERVDLSGEAWDRALAARPDASVFHGTAWLDFLAASQRAEPVRAVVMDRGRACGYFVGAVVHRMGLRILGSPLPGWATPHMGFVLDEGVDRRAAADALVEFAFQSLGHHHVELDDERLTLAQMAGSGWSAEPWLTYHVDLTASEDEILARMNPHRRQYIRRAVRRGMTVETSADVAFADEYYAQLLDVFSRQGLRPAYGAETVRQLIRALQPSGQLLMLRARGPDGSSMASLISVGNGRTAIAWGAALLRDHAEHHPMEFLWWETMRRWQERGATRFDLNGRADYGRGDYKAKYGGSAVERARFYRSRYPILKVGREATRRLVRARQSALGHADLRARSHSARP